MAVLSLGPTSLTLTAPSFLITLLFILHSTLSLLKAIRSRVKITALGGISFNRESHRVMFRFFLRSIFHIMIIRHEDSVKSSWWVEHASSSLKYSPSDHFPFSTLPILSSLQISVPKILVANVFALVAAGLITWIGKYAILAYQVARYLSASKTPTDSFQNPPKKILIVHGSVGAGHKRAAQALSETFALKHPEIQVEVIDIVDYAGSFFHAIYKTGYLALAERNWGSHLVGYWFDAGNTDRPGWGKRLIQEAFLLDFISHIYKTSPDVIINTHFLSTEIVAGLRRRGLLKIPQVTVVTDYDAHAFWANYPCEGFFVGQDGAVANLTHVNHDIDEDRVHVTGIPCVPVFSEVASKKVCMKNLGLMGEAGRPVVMITASGAMFEGRPSVFTIYEQALSCATPLEIVIITGRQKDLRAELEKVEVPERHVVKLEGFTRVMHEYMKASDVIVTKPGGLTTAESIGIGLAMVIVNPYPGQEMRNTDNLLEKGIAVKCNDLYLLGAKLESVVGDAKRMKAMQKASKAYGNLGACFEICEFIAEGQYGYIEVEKAKEQ